MKRSFFSHRGEKFLSGTLKVGKFFLFYLSLLGILSIAFTSCGLGREGTCRGDYDCPEEKICESSACIKPYCTKERPCSGGLICSKGRCIKCSEDGECGKGKICVKGTCRQGCRSDKECGKGKICIKGTCRQGCRSDRECGKGKICVEENCRSGCRSDGDCPSSTPKCDSKSLTCVECLTRGDCSAGYVCKENRCSSCSSDGDCQGGFICDAGICRAGCRKSSDCSSGQICSPALKVCVGCTSDGDCKDGLICKNNRCKSCSSKSDCGRGRVCVQGKCKRGNCVKTEECPKGQVCRNNYCSPCLSDSECPSGNLCAGGICRPCRDGKKNGDESDTDCGGSCPQKCDEGKSCKRDSDCKEGRCIGGRCIISNVKYWTAEGKKTACTSSAQYSAIPDLKLTVNLKLESVVLTVLDINVEGEKGGDGVAVRFKVNNSVDPNWTSVRQLGAKDGRTSIHLFRIDKLGPGIHQIEAQWASLSGNICNKTSDNSSGEKLWIRKITALAFPSALGVKWDYKVGKADFCHDNTSIRELSDLSTEVLLSETSAVLGLFTINITGNKSAGANFKLEMDGKEDITSISLEIDQAVAPSGKGQIRLLSLHRIAQLTPGKRALKVKWGPTVKKICNLAGDKSKTFTRRLGVIALPLSAGVLSAYVEGDPKKHSCINLNSPSQFKNLQPVPEMNLSLQLTRQSVVFTNFELNHRIYYVKDGSWGAIALAVDGSLSPVGISSYSNDKLSGLLNIHWIGALAPGKHGFAGYWKMGKGKICQINNLPVYTRRLGILAVPLKLK